MIFIHILLLFDVGFQSFVFSAQIDVGFDGGAKVSLVDAEHFTSEG